MGNRGFTLCICLQKVGFLCTNQTMLKRGFRGLSKNNLALGGGKTSSLSRMSSRITF